MTSDDYSDLPAWIRPGAKVADSDGNYETIVKITRTQVVTRNDQYNSSETRYNRTPNSRGEYIRRGAYFHRLMRRDDPIVINIHIAMTATAAADEVAAARKIYGNPAASGDKRPSHERAMDLIDAIENAARRARRRIERLTGLGAHLAAEHAQDITVD